MADIKKGLGPDHIVNDVDMSDYATKTELNNGLAGKQDSGDYATNTALTNGLAGKANSSHGAHSGWVPSTGGGFSGNVNWWGAGNGEAWYQTASSQWSNAYLTTTMTIIQKYGNPSSRVLKSNIVPLSADAFDKITPVSYTFKDDARVHESERGKQRFGFIAEEVRDAGVPTESWVFEEDQGEKDENGEVVTAALPEVTLLKPIDLTAVLWAKVQELEQRIAELENKE